MAKKSTRGDRCAERTGSRAALLGLVLLVGCASTRSEDEDAVLELAYGPAAYSAVDEGAREVPEVVPESPAEWTLDAILVRVSASNPTVGQALANLDLARARRSELQLSSWPQLSLGLDYLSTDNPGQAFGILLNQEQLNLGPGFDATPGATENWREEVRLDWALFAPGLREQKRAAGAGEQAALLAGEAIERRIQNAAVQATLGLGAAVALDAVAVESVAVMEQRLEQTRKRQAEGAALRADVLRFEVHLAAARQDAAQARLAVSGAESILNALMGRPADAALVLAGEDFEVALGLPDDLAALEALAEQERLDLRAAWERVRMLGFEREAAHAERRPSLQAFAAYDIDGPEPTLDTEFDSYVVGVGVRLPFTAGTGARIRQAEARERGAREAARGLGLEVSREVRDAWLALAAARETRALAEASSGAAKEAFRIMAEAQDAGGATTTDVLEANDMRERARVRLVAARAGVQIARAKLVVAVGGVR